MSRYIDADALKIAIDKEIFRHDTIDHVFQIIDDAPTIDAVSVVRCKECKYYETDECPMVYYSPLGDGIYDTRWWNKADDYCSWGEKETDHE